MVKTPSMSRGEALDAAQRALGYNRPDGIINSANRSHIKKWLAAEGVAYSYVQTLSLDALCNVWRDTSNGTLATIRALSQSVRRTDAPLDIEDIEDGQDSGTTEGQAATVAKRPNADQAARKLAEALEMFSGLNTKTAALDEGRVIQLIKQHAPKPESALCHVEVKFPDRPQINTDAAPRHSAFEEILAALSCGLNVMAVGPAGCGKTHLGEQIAEAMGRKFGFSGAVSSEYKLLGFIDAQGRVVRTAYRDSYEHGGLFLKDEIDGSSANALLALNAGMANGHQDFPDGVVKRHEMHALMASANTYGNGADRQYVGRNQLDRASLDRFYTIEMDYDAKLERTIYGDGEWTAYCQSARAAIRKLNIRHVVSMRAIDQGARMLASGIDRKLVERGALWKHLDAADVAKIKGAM